MIVATAGHVDHGKTSLVRNLTGVETDRLEEEKRRGLTINLGYAFLALSQGKQPQDRIGFIDVPGHSGFINTMISGISGIDLGLLVVAANDGPMPQTIEHIQVMRLLGVNNFAVAITHIDTVDQAQLDGVSQSIRAVLEQEGCDAKAAVFPVDNISGAGIPALRTYLEGLAAKQKSQALAGYFRLSIDRAFHLKGSGLIVTGTALSGRVAPEDNLVLLPQQTTLRIRSLHADNEAATSASAGQRCALNIVGDISKAQIQRGDWLVCPGAGPATRRIDTRVRLLAGAPFGLKHLSPVKVYIGAARLSARLSLLEKSEGNSRIKPGEQQLAQLILEREISCCHADRFLLRDDSESVLLGGGEVLDPWGPHTGKYKAERLSLLGALDEGSFIGAVEKLLFEHQHIADLTHLAQARNLSLEQARDALNKSTHCEQIISWQAKGVDYCAAREQYNAAEAHLLQSLSQWHRDHPQDKGMPAKLGSAALPKKLQALLVPVTTGLISTGKIKLANGLLSRSDHRVTLPGGEVRAWMRVEEALIKYGKTVPTVGDLAAQLQLPPKALLATLRAAVAAGQLHQISDKRFVLPSQMQNFANCVAQLGQDNTDFSVIEYRDQLKIGRNQAVELLEYFDRMKFTRRNGNQRLVVDAHFPDRYVRPA